MNTISLGKTMLVVCLVSVGLFAHAALAFSYDSGSYGYAPVTLSAAPIYYAQPPVVGGQQGSMGTVYVPGQNGNPCAGPCPEAYNPYGYGGLGSAWQPAYLASQSYSALERATMVSTTTTRQYSRTQNWYGAPRQQPDYFAYSYNNLHGYTAYPAY